MMMQFRPLRGLAALLPGLLLCGAARALDMNDLGALTTGPQQTPRVEGQLVLDRPIDAETYRMGPGDRVGLYAYNLQRTQDQIPVGSDGRLELPGLGRVDTRGLSLAELRRRQGRRLAQVFDCDSVELWIAQPRRIRVQVSGAGVDPRWQELDYLGRLSSVLQAPETPPPLADPDAALPALVKPEEKQPEPSWRNVLIQRDDSLLSVDLLYHLRTGDLVENPVLESGDRVIWSWRGATLMANGPFRQQDGDVEYRPGDTPARIVALLGGPREGLGGARYELVRTQEDGDLHSWRFSSQDADFRGLELRPHDRLYLRVENERDPAEQASVQGQVRRPGSFPIQPGHTMLADLLAQALPDSATADLAHVRVLRKLEHDPETRYAGEILQLGWLNRFEHDYLKSRILHEGGRVSLCYDGAYFDPAKVPLLDGDQVQVLRHGREVEVLGAVGQPGLQAWRPGWSAQDYVKAAGGRLRGAKLSELRLRRAGEDQFGPPPKDYEPAAGDILMLMYREEMTTWEKFKEGLAVTTQLLTVVLVSRSF